MANNLSYNPPYGLGQSGSTTVGGGGTPLIGARDILDAKRMMQTGRTPYAEYPDGYLGNVNSRRGDRVLDNLKSRNASRPYSRGVHKGERIEPGDYFWPENFNPNTGLEYEKRGKKWTAKVVDDERLAHFGTYNITDPATMGRLVAADAHRNEYLQRLRPAWR